MENLFKITLFLIVFASCKTTKENQYVVVDSKTETNKVVSNNDVTVTDVSVSSTITDKSVAIDSTITEITETVFNNPDSTGHQSVDRVIKTTKVNVKKDSKNIFTQNTDTSKIKSIHFGLNYIKETMQSSIEVENTTVKTNRKFFVNIGFAVGVLLLIFFILKKEKII